MGSAKKKAEEALDYGANVLVKGATAGAVDTKGNGWAQGGEFDLYDATSGMGGVAVSEGVKSITPKPPEMPKAEDPKEIAARAKKEADAKVMNELGERSKGLSSTILGGTLGDDSTVLKKKKLLGE